LRTKLLVAATASVVASGCLAGVAGAQTQPRGLVEASASEAVVVNRGFLSPLAKLSGDVRVGRQVFVAPNAQLLADRGRRVCLGRQAAVEDNALVITSAERGPLRGRCPRGSTSIGNRTVVDHQAEVVNSALGTDAYVGMRARVRNARLANGVIVGPGAVVTGVSIARNRLVPAGTVVSTQEQARVLPARGGGDVALVVSERAVHREFVRRYIARYRSNGLRALLGVTASPSMSFRPVGVPTIGAGTSRDPLVTIVGDVRTGLSTVFGRGTTVRADEGAPIVIGDTSSIETNVSIHALRGSSVSIGTNLNTDDNDVLHGPLTIGANVTVGDDSVLFAANVGNRVNIADRVIVAGPPADPIEIRDGAYLAPGTVITTQAQADALPAGGAVPVPPS
jgi:carbonic anhydrase/acetyltransferase-like protein (isoleucine patch superfamily)